MKSFVVTEASPGLNVTSDEAILKHIMGHSFQNWHASCTCRMGRTDDSMAVVDSKARVIGVNGLRVVDASSFALLPPGHPQSTVCELSFCLTRSRCVAMLMIGCRSDGREDCGGHIGNCVVHTLEKAVTISGAGIRCSRRSLVIRRIEERLLSYGERMEGFGRRVRYRPHLGVRSCRCRRSASRSASADLSLTSLITPLHTACYRNIAERPEHAYQKHGRPDYQRRDTPRPRGQSDLTWRDAHQYACTTRGNLSDSVTMYLTL
jgi:hypothetical protein